MSNRNKILLILHLPPPVHGASLVGEMILKSKLLNNSFDCTYINLSSTKNISEIGKFRLSKVMVILSLYFKVLRTLLLSKFNFCYVTMNSKGLGFYKDFGIVILLKLFRVKVVYHFHNKGVSLYHDRFLDDLLYRLAFHRSRAILLSEMLYSDVKKYLSRDQVFFCPNGISSMPVDSSQRTQNSTCRLLFISSMMRAKGVWDLLDACEILKRKGLTFTCDFIGKWLDVDESSFKKEVLRKNLANCVFSHGAQYGTNKHKFLAEADVFVLPSQNEAYPLVLLEAMQYGLPVVSTYEGAIPEIVDYDVNGLLVAKSDISDLASKIEYLITNPSVRDEFGVNGSNKFRNHYTVDIFEENIVEIFNQILTS